MASSQDKLDKIYRSFPKIMKPAQNPVLNALIQGFGGADVEILDQLENTKAQMFIKTASGQYLNRLASGVGVARPTELGLSDEQFRNLVPNLSLKAKLIRKVFYDTMDVFWGVLFSRANLIANNAAPYNVSAGDEFSFKMNNGALQTVKVLSADIDIPGAATITEIQAILSKINGLETDVKVDPATNDEYLICYTEVSGLNGSLEVVASSGIDVLKLDLDVGVVELWQQPQRSIIYEIRPNELTIEIPAIVPSLRRTLKGSHHFHADSTIELPQPTENGIWAGSFLFDESGSTANYTVTGENAQIQEVLTKGNIYTKVTVDDNSKFEDESGLLIFGWGTDSQELPVRYRGLPNSNTVLLDPSYVFQNDQSINTYINVLENQIAFSPAKDGSDLPIYLTSPSSARALVQTILESLVAAGVVVTFVILAPTYRYIIDNPYISEDDAPSV